MRIFTKKSEQQIKAEKLEKLEKKLQKLLEKITKKGPIKQMLWKIILDKNLAFSVRRIAVNQFLGQKDLTPAELADLILKLSDDFGPEKEVAAKKFREIAAKNDLYDAIVSQDEYLLKVGWAEFLYRIQKRSIGRDYTKWVCVQAIKHKNELMVPAWKMYKQLLEENLSLEDVKDLLSIIDLNLNPNITSEAQKLAKEIQVRFAKVHSSNKTIAKIEEVIKQIQELKREQG